MQTLEISKLVADPNQPRKYFAADLMRTLISQIKRDGILSPLIICENKGLDTYRIIDGERRYRAATILCLKEVSVKIIKVESDIDLAVKRFQIQETHANWTELEKANSLVQITEQLNQPLKEVATLLGIKNKTIRRYVALAKLADRKAFVENEIPIDFIEYIIGVINLAKKITNEVMKEKFDRTEQKSLERAIIEKIKKNQILGRHNFTQIKDSFLKDSKYIDKFINSNISPEAMFYETKAQGAFHLRNAMNSCGYTKNHLIKFLESGDLKLSENNISNLKATYSQIKKVLDKVE